jgi:metal-responsive CopG/Arc/MetJ family transcriptional regulator
MARSETLVQLTDDLRRLLDERAAREGRSRSALIRDAITSYLRDERETEIDRAIVDGYTRVPQTADEQALHELNAAMAARHVEPW